MKLFSTSLLSLLLASSLASAAPASRPEQQQLIGKWTHQRLEQHPKGEAVRIMPSKGDAFMEFRADGSWTMTSPDNTNGGTYSWVDRKSIATVTTSSNLAPQIGWKSVKQVAVSAKTLTLTTRYDKTAQLPNMTVRSVFERSAP
jgi:hypothetical protein